MRIVHRAAGRRRWHGNYLGCRSCTVTVVVVVVVTVTVVVVTVSVVVVRIQFVVQPRDRSPSMARRLGGKDGTATLSCRSCAVTVVVVTVSVVVVRTIQFIVQPRDRSPSMVSDITETPSIVESPVETPIFVVTEERDLQQQVRESPSSRDHHHVTIVSQSVSQTHHRSVRFSSFKNYKHSRKIITKQFNLIV